MSNCARCGRRIGFLEGEFAPFQDAQYRVICEGCQSILKNSVDIELEKLIEERVPFEQIVDNLSEKYRCEQCSGSKEYLEAYINHKKDDIVNKSLTEDDRFLCQGRKICKASILQGCMDQQLWKMYCLREW